MSPTTRIRTRRVTPFFNLSSEIRLCIYDSLFHGIVFSHKYRRPPYGTMLNGLFRRYENTTPDLVKEDYMAILRVCKLTRKEARPITYQNLQLYLDGFFPPTKFLSNHMISNVRVVQLSMYPPPREIKIDPKQFPKLEMLVLDFGYHPYVHDVRHVLEALNGSDERVRSDTMNRYEISGTYRPYRYPINFILKLLLDQSRKFRVRCHIVPRRYRRNCYNRANMISIDGVRNDEYELEAATWQLPLPLYESSL